MEIDSSTKDDGSSSEIPTNPFEIVEMIRRANSMNNATNPSDALDEALDSFNIIEENKKINSTNKFLKILQLNMIKSPIPKVTNKLQNRAIGIINGVYKPSDSNKLNRGVLVDQKGKELKHYSW